MLAFHDRIRTEQIGLYKQFTDDADLELKLVSFFVSHVADHSVTQSAPPTGVLPQAATTMPAPSAESEELDDARQQIGEALQGWADLAYGREASPDRDRLLSFALALSQDRETMGAHLANRLYRRRRTLVISMGESELWARSIAADIARTGPMDSSRVIPGMFFLQRREQAQGREFLDMALEDSTPAAAGALTVMRALGERPYTLWPLQQSTAEAATRTKTPGRANGTAGADADSGLDQEPSLDSAVDLWNQLLTKDDTRGPALDYLHAVAGGGDLTLLGHLRDSPAASNSPDVAAALAAETGNHQAAIDYLLAHPYSVPDWLRDPVLASIGALPPEQLQALVISRHSEQDIRIAAFDRLTRITDDPSLGVPATTAMLRPSERSRRHLLQPLSRDDPDTDSKTGGADGLATRRAWLRAAWDAFPEGDRKGDLEVEVDAALTGTEELTASLDQGWRAYAAWKALGHRAPASLRDQAREVLATNAASLVDTMNLGPPDDPKAADLRQFVAGQLKTAALRILSGLTPDQRKPEDLELVRAQVTDPDWGTVRQALLSLATLGTTEDGTTLLEASEPALLMPDDRRTVLQAAARLGGSTVARTILDGERNADVGADALLAADDVTPDEKLELLYHPNDTIRMRAVEHAFATMDRDALETLLDRYPAREGPYYYNVIASLDWHLYASPPGATSLPEALDTAEQP